MLSEADASQKRDSYCYQFFYKVQLLLLLLLALFFLPSVPRSRGRWKIKKTDIQIGVWSIIIIIIIIKNVKIIVTSTEASRAP